MIVNNFTKANKRLSPQTIKTIKDHDVWYLKSTPWLGNRGKNHVMTTSINFHCAHELEQTRIIQ